MSEKPVVTKEEKKDIEEKRTLTVFGPETDFDGVLEFSDDLIITGRFNGKIKATGNLEISKDAVCTVDSIQVKSIVISGSVTGDINASERVEICSGASVTGDISTARLRIANNVEFEGQITMLDGQPDENIFSVASKEYKDALVLRSDVIE
jgi:cytoskeletal protein CcmA (bactofilin family)